MGFGSSKVWRRHRQNRSADTVKSQSEFKNLLLYRVVNNDRRKQQDRQLSLPVIEILPEVRQHTMNKRWKKDKVRNIPPYSLDVAHTQYLDPGSFDKLSGQIESYRHAPFWRGVQTWRHKIFSVTRNVLW